MNILRPALPAAALLLAAALAGRGAGLDTNAVRLATDVAAPVQGVAAAGDRAVTLGGGAGLFFDARAAGLPAGANIDALLVHSNRILFSTDKTVALGGTPYDDEDLVAWNANTGLFSLYWDGSARGVPRAADLDAACFEHGTTNLWLSFDVTTALPGGITANDEDVVRFANGAFSLRFRGTNELGLPDLADLVSLYHDGSNLYFSLDRTVTLGGLTGTDGDVWKVQTNTLARTRLTGFGLDGRAELAALDFPLDADGDLLTDFEESSGLDEAASVWPATGAPLSPGGYTSNPQAVDSDGDGYADGQEALAGSNPASGVDYLRQTQAARQTGSSLDLAWASAPGRSYTIEGAWRMVPAAFTNVVASGVAAAAGTNVTHYTVSGTTNFYFYRVRLTP